MICANKTDMRDTMEKQGRKVVHFEDGQRLARVSIPMSHVYHHITVCIFFEIRFGRTWEREKVRYKDSNKWIKMLKAPNECILQA